MLEIELALDRCFVWTNIAAVHDPTIISPLTEADGVAVPNEYTFIVGLALKVGICLSQKLDAK